MVKEFRQERALRAREVWRRGAEAPAPRAPASGALSDPRAEAGPSERAPLALEGSATYTDTELRGFMLIVGRTSKRYYAQTLVNGRQVRVGHALRRVYATLALEAGVPIAELSFLLNHAVSSGGVTMGYLHPSLHHLR